ncbi:MAG: ATP-binding protein, partial [Campylobacterota bacterium]|nr:ATP-binding protein [Campylobacterota bacterium]
MLNIDTKNLNNKKNLLAFSAGIDSSALFFLLLENNIKFDIAIVDYNIRDQSKKEVTHA